MSLLAAGYSRWGEYFSSLGPSSGGRGFSGGFLEAARRRQSGGANSKGCGRTVTAGSRLLPITA